MSRIMVVPGMAVREYARPACEAVEGRGHRVDLLKAPSWRGLPVGLDAYGHRIAAQLEEKDARVDVLIGLSVGTQVVAAATTNTDRVGTVVLISPTFDPRIRSMRGTMSRWFERGEGDDQSDWGRQLRDWTHTDPVRIEHDRMSRPEWVESLAVDNDGRYHYQPGGKHSWPVEDVETFADFVDGLL